LINYNLLVDRVLHPSWPASSEPALFTMLMRLCQLDRSREVEYERVFVYKYSVTTDREHNASICLEFADRN